MISNPRLEPIFENKFEYPTLIAFLFLKQSSGDVLELLILFEKKLKVSYSIFWQIQQYTKYAFDSSFISFESNFNSLINS